MIDVGISCCGCGNCELVCPKKCIKIEPDAKGFLYPAVNAEACIECGRCITSCPAIRADRILPDENTEFYSACNKNNRDRQTSSSGGFFHVLAENCLNKGGAVCGAAFDYETNELRHISIETIEDLPPLKGSKYVQSDLDQIFMEIEKMLKGGRTVLFTGTPCQVSAVHAYLGRDYNNLITMDIVCHGVASPLMWAKYSSEMEKQYNSRITAVSFRDKRYGWKYYSMKLSFRNGRKYLNFFKRDLFGRAYLSNIMLRPACYACPYTKVERESDFTVGDFWLNRNLMNDDDGGISLIIIHTEKGKRLWNEIKPQFEYLKLTREQAVKGNANLHEPVKCALDSDGFFECADKESFSKAVKKHVPNKLTPKLRLLYFAKRIGLK